MSDLKEMCDVLKEEKTEVERKLAHLCGVCSNISNFFSPNRSLICCSCKVWAQRENRTGAGEDHRTDEEGGGESSERERELEKSTSCQSSGAAYHVRTGS